MLIDGKNKIENPMVRVKHKVNINDIIGFNMLEMKQA